MQATCGTLPFNDDLSSYHESHEFIECNEAPNLDSIRVIRGVFLTRIVTTQVVIERQCTARCLQRVAPRISEVCTQ